MDNNYNVESLKEIIEDTNKLLEYAQTNYYTAGNLTIHTMIMDIKFQLRTLLEVNEKLIEGGSLI